MNDYKLRKNNNGLKELRSKLPHGDIGKIINSFIFENHRDTIIWRLNNIPLKLNDHPFKLILTQQHKCYICDINLPNNIIREKLIKYSFMEDGTLYNSDSRYGWQYCQRCACRLNNFVVPKWHSNNNLLPFECYNRTRGMKKIIKWGGCLYGDKILKKDTRYLKFDRISVSNPERNGLTNCLITLNFGSIFRIHDGKILINVMWVDKENEIVHKFIRLSNLLKNNKNILWGSLDEFIDDFCLNKYNLTENAMMTWKEKLVDCLWIG